MTITDMEGWFVEVLVETDATSILQALLVGRIMNITSFAVLLKL